jgi:hypothetical protein
MGISALYLISTTKTPEPDDENKVRRKLLASVRMNQEAS